MGINHKGFFAYRCAMTTPTLRQLEIFAQMVASGNIADCALALGMAEAAVKSDLRALQHRLGHQLFVIEGTEFQLTPIGHKTVDAMAMLTAAASPAVEEETPAAPPETPVADDFAEGSAPVLETGNGAEIAEADQPPESAPAIEDFPSLTPEPLAEVEPSPVPEEESDILELSAYAEPEAAAALPTPAQEERLGDLPAPSTLIKSVPNLDDIEWPPPVKRVSWVNDEPLELTDIAPEPADASAETVDVLLEEPVQQESGQAEEAAAPAEEPRDISPDIDDSDKVTPLPIVNTLAVRVVFAAPAPATVPPPTVISLFAAVPLPVPANDPEPAPPIAPAPVVELKHAQQQVTLAAHPSVFGHFQEALTAFEQANPDVAIALELDAFTAMRAEPLLASGEVDIVYYYAMGERERFESRYVWSESLSIFIGADHPLARQEAITVEDLVGVRPVLLGSRNPLRPILDNAMIRGGVDLWHPALETDNLYDIMTAVRDGAGYFAAFGPLARDFGKMPGIRRLPLVDPLPPVEVRQAVREDVRDDPVISSLAEYLFR
jgi:DNA-binding transcriptional LysR family regulator